MHFLQSFSINNHRHDGDDYYDNDDNDDDDNEVEGNDDDDNDDDDVMWEEEEEQSPPHLTNWPNQISATVHCVSYFTHHCILFLHCTLVLEQRIVGRYGSPGEAKQQGG